MDKFSLKRTTNSSFVNLTIAQLLSLIGQWVQNGKANLTRNELQSILVSIVKGIETIGGSNQGTTYTFDTSTTGQVTITDSNNSPPIVINLGVLSLNGNVVTDNGNGSYTITAATQGDINNINTTITNIQGDITNIQGDISNIQTTITNVVNDITNLQGNSHPDDDVESVTGPLIVTNGDIRNPVTRIPNASEIPTTITNNPIISDNALVQEALLELGVALNNAGNPVGQLVGSSDTYANLPTTTADGNPVNNSDWVALTEVDGTHKKGLYAWDGTQYVLYLEVDIDLTNINNAINDINNQLAIDWTTENIGGTTVILNDGVSSKEWVGTLFGADQTISIDNTAYSGGDRLIIGKMVGFAGIITLDVINFTNKFFYDGPDVLTTLTLNPGDNVTLLRNPDGGWRVTSKYPPAAPAIVDNSAYIDNTGNAVLNPNDEARRDGDVVIGDIIQPAEAKLHIVANSNAYNNRAFKVEDVNKEEMFIIRDDKLTVMSGSAAIKPRTRINSTSDNDGLTLTPTVLLSDAHFSAGNAATETHLHIVTSKFDALNTGSTPFMNYYRYRVFGSLLDFGVNPVRTVIDFQVDIQLSSQPSVSVSSFTIINKPPDLNVDLYIEDTDDLPVLMISRVDGDTLGALELTVDTYSSRFNICEVNPLSVFNDGTTLTGTNVTTTPPEVITVDSSAFVTTSLGTTPRLESGLAAYRKGITYFETTAGAEKFKINPFSSTTTPVTKTTASSASSDHYVSETYDGFGELIKRTTNHGDTFQNGELAIRGKKQYQLNDTAANFPVSHLFAGSARVTSSDATNGFTSGGLRCNTIHIQFSSNGRVSGRVFGNIVGLRRNNNPSNTGYNFARESSLDLRFAANTGSNAYESVSNDANQYQTNWYIESGKPVLRIQFPTAMIRTVNGIIHSLIHVDTYGINTTGSITTTNNQVETIRFFNDDEFIGGVTPPNLFTDEPLRDPNLPALRTEVHAEDYGLSESNTEADNTTALYNAFNAADCVIIPVGEFAIEEFFIPRDGCQLRGTKKPAYNSTHTGMVEGSILKGARININQKKNVILKDFGIDNVFLGTQNTIDNNAIYLEVLPVSSSSLAMNLHIDNMILLGVNVANGDAAIVLGSGSDCRVTNTHIHGYSRGIDVYHDNHIIDNCDIRYCEDYSIWMEVQGSNATIQNIRIENCTFEGEPTDYVTGANASSKSGTIGFKREVVASGARAINFVRVNNCEFFTMDKAFNIDAGSGGAGGLISQIHINNCNFDFCNNIITMTGNESDFIRFVNARIFTCVNIPFVGNGAGTHKDIISSYIQVNSTALTSGSWRTTDIMQD